MFLPNQKIACVGGSHLRRIDKLYTELPKEGSTYTIRDIVPGVGLTGDEGEVAVYLCEIKVFWSQHVSSEPKGSLL